MSVRYAPDGRKIYYKDSDPGAGGVYESHAAHSRRVRTKKAERAGVSYEAYPEWARFYVNNKNLKNIYESTSFNLNKRIKLSNIIREKYSQDNF